MKKQSYPKKKGICCYCGGTKPLTKDHIPPRNIFPKPRPSNLITVPCCEECRVGWSNDDEYFRLAISVTSNVEGDVYASKNQDTIMRSLQKPNKQGFARFIHDSLDHIAINTPSGIYLGHAPALKINQERINRVSERIIRGLFFTVLKIPLPSEYEVKNVISQLGIPSWLDNNDNAFKPWTTIGDNQFSYTYAQTSEDPYSIVWVSLFYGKLYFLGFTVKPKHLR